MGTMITLALDKLEVDWGKNNYFSNHGSLYQRGDYGDVPAYYVGPGESDDLIVETEKGLSKPLRLIKDRLELLGHTLPAVEHEYTELHRFHGLSEQPLPFEHLRDALARVDVGSVSAVYGDDYDPGKFVRREILDRLELQSLHSRVSEVRSELQEAEMLLENFSPNGRLRLLAENPANHPIPVNWAFSPLIESGYAQPEHFVAGAPTSSQFLLVTEGSSDAKILLRAFEIYRPHVADFFRFVDMTEGYPFTGTGNLFRFAQGLSGIGVQNKTVIIYDNDAEGVSKYNKTADLGLPPNMRAMVLPELPEFTGFRTVGPEGESASDINGRAAAIECYLDLDRDGLPDPLVRWTAFDRQSMSYQGELVEKEKYTKNFMKQREANDDYACEKITTVLEAIISECIGIAEVEALDMQVDRNAW